MMRRGVRVIKRQSETFEQMLKRFTKAYEKSGIISDVKKHEYFDKQLHRKRKPGEKRD